MSSQYCFKETDVVMTTSDNGRMIDMSLRHVPTCTTVRGSDISHYLLKRSLLKKLNSKLLSKG